MNKKAKSKNPHWNWHLTEAKTKLQEGKGIAHQDVLGEFREKVRYDAFRRMVPKGKRKEK